MFQFPVAMAQKLPLPILILALSAFPASLGAGQGPLHLQNEPEVLRPWAIPHILSNTGATRALPTNVRPDHYKLILRPIVEPGEWRTPGELNLTVRCVEATNRITIHQLDINMGDAMVWHETTEFRLEIVGIEENEPENEYTLVLDSNLVPGQRYVVFYQFESPIPETSSGLYRSSYIDPATGETKWAASTQFQRSSARRAFPCFDEPGARSTFEVTLVRRDSFHTLANMPLNRTEPDPENVGWFWDHYNPTPSMPVYLIAIVVSDFAYFEAPLDEMNGRPSRVWAPAPWLANGAGEYGAVTSARSILAFEEMFEIEYPLAKLDSGAIPVFAAGAMENWGLVLYRESLLLYVNGKNTETERRQVSTVVNHELAHQWFGNLVTCATWADIWLNEGFASYFEKHGIQATDPEFEPLDWTVVEAHQPGLLYDEGPDSYPIHNDGPNPSRIVYQKAAAVIRMMDDFLGHETFIRGLRRYMNRYRYHSVTQNDLFQALHEQAWEEEALPITLTMKMIMDTWTHQSGFPLVRVFRLSSTHISYTQESYGPHPRKINNTLLDPAHFWYIPFRLRSPTLPDPGDSPVAWMSKTQSFATYGPIDTSRWILLNPDSKAFYRVLYDDALAGRLLEQLAVDHTQIPVGSRAQLIDDYFRFAFATPTPYTTMAKALEWTSYLGAEESLFPWNSFFNIMGATPFNNFHGHFAFGVFRDFYGPKVASALRLVGVEQPANERGSRTILRARLLDWNCAFGGDSCKEYATKLYEAIVESPTENPVPADIQATMYCAIVAYPQPPSADPLLMAASKWLLALNIPGQEVQAIRWRNAVGCAKREEDVAAALDLAMNNGAFPQTERLALLQAIASSSREGRAALLEWFDQEFDTLLERFGPTGFLQVMMTLASYVSVDADVAQLRRLVEANTDDLEVVLPALEVVFTAMGRNVEWMDNYGRQIVEWMNGV